MTELNLTIGDWWLEVVFPPPPPRPFFILDSSCDLCKWKQSPSLGVETTTELFTLPTTTSQLNWVLTLVIVSLVSAAVGAAVMILLFRFRARKNKTGNAAVIENKSNSAATTTVSNHYTHMDITGGKDGVYTELEEHPGKNSTFQETTNDDCMYEEVGLNWMTNNIA